MSLWGSSAQATSYYWDDNGAFTGTTAAPTGTLGTSAFLSTSAAGTAATTATTPTNADTLQFVAGSAAVGSDANGNALTVLSGSSAFTVSVNGTQSLAGLIFRQAGALTLGASAGTGTINLGASGFNTTRNVNGNNNNNGSGTVGAVIINSNLALTADQTWTTGNAAATTVAGATSGTANLAINPSSSGLFTVSGAVNTTGALSLATASAASTISVTGAVANTVSAVTVASTAGLVNLGRTGNLGNAYTGTTQVNSGTLRIFGGGTVASATGTSAVNVNGATAILAGSGRSTGLLTVTNGGNISPSGGALNSTGTVSNNSDTGTLRLGATGGVVLTQATLNFNLSSTAAGVNDQIVTGALTLNNVTLNLSPTALNTGLALDTTAAYTLIDNNGTAPLDLSTATLTTNITGFATGYNATYSSNDTGDLLVTFAPVPEPSTWVGIVLALVTLGLAKRKRIFAAVA